LDQGIWLRIPDAKDFAIVVICWAPFRGKYPMRLMIQKFRPNPSTKLPLFNKYLKRSNGCIENNKNGDSQQQRPLRSPNRQQLPLHLLATLQKKNDKKKEGHSQKLKEFTSVEYGRDSGAKPKCEPEAKSPLGLNNPKTAARIDRRYWHWPPDLLKPYSRWKVQLPRHASATL